MTNSSGSLTVSGPMANIPKSAGLTSVAGRDAGDQTDTLFIALWMVESLIANRVIFGLWRGFAITDDGEFRFEQVADGDWKVWRWDGKRFRRVKRWPDYLLDFDDR